MGPPPPTGPMGPSGGVAGMSVNSNPIQTPNYFTEQKKGEVNELMNLLRQVSVERDSKKKREVVKKVYFIIYSKPKSYLMIGYRLHDVGN